MGWHLPLLPALLLLLAAAGASAATSQSHATATSFIAASGSDEAEGYMPHSSLSGLLARAFPAAAAPSLNTLNTNATAAASARSKLRSTLDRCILDALAPHYSGLLLRAHELHQPGVVELLQVGMVCPGYVTDAGNGAPKAPDVVVTSWGSFGHTTWNGGVAELLQVGASWGQVRSWREGRRAGCNAVRNCQHSDRRVFLRSHGLHGKGLVTSPPL